MKFIRLDMKGHWRGTEHRSMISGLGGECYCYDECICNKNWEDGISCYRLDDVGYALENLRYYWFEIASLSENELKDMQVTIFEGDLVGMGSDWEDLATCKRTLYEFDAYDLMMIVKQTHDDYFFGDISEDEYKKRLNGLLSA